ncbi:branched-chain amino acid ABC transporter permease [Mesorhizobium sp. M7A.T.Ca.TU.009.01.3.2]|jgi:branched-chain amino acid transport system permease protein|uniref:branched-chain amino acid ABC transporter permease n=1 Tax=Mesorhizobium sp. M7A.F.Ca.MR.362.00.0.0 TaxID=2496779 RepID=UPI000FD5F613|nr:branched-chain amino acid ABC transporter permease [Mesorhizobium sp. M7A.F.Ca.MR.362.00.0.0]RUU13750.1 branched-chain amino acid ABC transporter permease [Mesorhizobium sp. M7A.T.Ca.TU.009.01.3.2]RUV10072.1 branched-chain amino acid ABC transporter permease [Mesorhizobium sp. M7A.T.Ca.TU.009.01.3.1]RWN97234.1 MAG: branched-chain amino acid ABC transporter permease [Mesorhizobium sp.]RUU76714.1 branched-chain amino acid ABC transporter permease [Mesorhizobium sp. M7A.F.Ca.MR.362.00.0.0]RWO4
MSEASPAKAYALHLGVIALLFVLSFLLPDYYHGLLARIMVLAVFAMGYNMLFGYVGLLSLGHAMFFAAGLYGAGLAVIQLGWSVPAAFASGLGCGVVVSLVIGLLALRTTGVAFMIVTMMFAQVFYLLILYFATWTGGDQGMVVPQPARVLSFGATSLELTNPTVRYMTALALFSIVLLVTLAIVRSRYGRVLVAIRENEERTKMLGYDTFSNKLAAVVISGIICAASGAAYALLFGYVGSSFASVQYSILPLLWVLLGGAATTLGPLIGTLFMYYVIDITSGYTSAYLLIVGIALILLVLFFPKGILGSIRQRWLGWLP